MNNFPILRIDSEPLIDGINYGFYGDILNECKFISPNEINDLKTQFQFYPIEHRPNIGDTYILSPFDNTYILTEYFSTYILQEKWRAIKDIVKFLHATKYEYKLESTKISKRQIDNSATMGYKTIADCDLNIKKQKDDGLKAKYHEKGTASPTGPLNNEDYEKALQIAQTTGLYADPIIKGLINSRNPNDTNLAKSSKYEFCVSKEINERLDIAFKLQTKANIFSISNEFVNATRERVDIVCELNIEFD